ncbi:MAG: tyrosine-type recombinase/integrase [Elusimicrobiota bacterium]
MDADLLMSYADNLKGRGMRSWKLYIHAARRFLTWLSAKELILSQVDPGLMHEYLCHRRTPEHRPATLKAVVDRLRTFFRYAIFRKMVTDDPTQGVSHRWMDIPGGLPGYQGVLRRMFRKPSHILRFHLPLFAPHWESYLEMLLEQGYSKNSLYIVMEHNAHFHRYLAGRGVRRLSRVTPRLMEAFLRHKQRRFRQSHGRPMPESYLQLIRSRLRDFLAHAWRHRRRNPKKAGRSKGNALIADSLLNAYLDFCRDHGGLRPVTTRAYHRELLRLRSFLGRRGIRHLRDLAPTDLDAFLVRRSKSMGPKGLRSVASALRSFLRYLHLDDHIPRDLAGSVVSPSRFRADLRPKYLSWRRIEKFLDSVDRGTPTGKRDYAILVLLACHGLRAREAANLKIADIDFGNQSIRLRQRKNGTTVDIPISERAAEALRDYMAVRRDHGHVELFLTAPAPVKPLYGLALSNMVQRRLHAAFGGRGGAYLLRHSFAKALLDQGARLSDIGAMLGHKSLRSTLIYTRIATEDMREVSHNYAEWL